MIEPKNELLQFVTTKDEKELIEKAAKDEERSVSQFCRLIILDKINKTKQK